MTARDTGNKQVTISSGCQIVLMRVRSVSKKPWKGSPLDSNEEWDEWVVPHRLVSLCLPSSLKLHWSCGRQRDRMDFTNNQIFDHNCQQGITFWNWSLYWNPLNLANHWAHHPSQANFTATFFLAMFSSSCIRDIYLITNQARALLNNTDIKCLIMSNILGFQPLRPWL